MAWAQSRKVTTRPQSNRKDGGRTHEAKRWKLTIVLSGRWYGERSLHHGPDGPFKLGDEINKFKLAVIDRE
jgi:hypothetical protein